MDNMLGLLRIHVKRGVNLAVRDVCSSDPYVVVKMGGKQFLILNLFDRSDGIAGSPVFHKNKLKTSVVKKNVNPEWNEDLTLSVTDPNAPVLLNVYDHDTFSLDDKMGDAEIDIHPFIRAVRMNMEGIPNGTIITKIHPSRSNCLSDESNVIWKDGKVVQDMFLRLRNVECGEVEIQLQWIDIPGSRAKPL